jgi:RNA polymerase primary sigma factor
MRETESQETRQDHPDADKPVTPPSRVKRGNPRNPCGRGKPRGPVVRKKEGNFDPRNLLGVYFNQMSRIPVLKREQEQELGGRIVRAREALKELRSEKVARDDERYTAAKHALRELENELMTRYLRLVVKVANHYRQRGMQMQDLIQEGNIGLYIAAKKFEPEKGYRFATYAVWWINHKIRRALSRFGRTIRLPDYVCDERFKYERAEEMLFMQSGCNPDYAPEPSEIAGLMGITEQKVKELRDLPYVRKSLDALIPDTKGMRMIDTVADPSAPPPDHALMYKDDRDYLKRLMNPLNPNEKKVVGERHGFTPAEETDLEEKTLQEIGNAMGLTRERIRQVEMRGLDKMRKEARILDSRTGSPAASPKRPPFCG